MFPVFFCFFFPLSVSTRWLTPVEIFKPHYAAAVARYMLKEMDPTYPLKVYELGGGMGTCAAGVLDHIRRGQKYNKIKSNQIKSNQINKNGLFTQHVFALNFEVLTEGKYVSLFSIGW